MSIAKLYSTRFSSHERIEKDRIWRVLCEEFFQDLIPPDSTLLDIACGYGEFSRHIIARKKLAIDLNPDAKEFLPDGVEFVRGSADQIPHIPDNSIDVCFSSNFLEHLKSKDQLDIVLREIYRVLKPGGRYIALQPNIRFCYDRYWDFYDHHTPLSDRSCEEAFRLSGFEIDRLIPRFLPYSTKSRVPRSSLFIKIYLKIPLTWKVFGEQFLIIGRKPGR